MNEALGLDELTLVFQACDRSMEGLKALCNCERVCRTWRDVLQAPEGAEAYYRVATGPRLQDVWGLLEATRTARAPRFAALDDKKGSFAAATVGDLKKAARDTDALAQLGGMPYALEGDPDGEVNVFADDDGAREWHFALDRVADVAGDRAIRSRVPFAAPGKFADSVDTADDRQAAVEADGIAEYWEASRRVPRRVHTHVWQPRLDDGALILVPLECFYFEVSLQASDSTTPATVDRDECVAVGLGTARFQLSGSQPGWTNRSIGYHSDDGNLFRATGHGRSYGPRFGDGDTVGCGICLLTHAVFFTHNGKYLGVATHDWIGDQELFPIVGVGSHMRGTIRFGASIDKPSGGFMFDPASWPAVRADDFRRTPPRPVRQRLPAGLEELESLESDHPVLVALLQLLQQLGITHEHEHEDEDSVEEPAPSHPMQEARAAYIRQLVARLGHMEDGEFVMHEDDTDEDDDDREGLLVSSNFCSAVVLLPPTQT